MLLNAFQSRMTTRSLSWLIILACCNTKTWTCSLQCSGHHHMGKHHLTRAMRQSRPSIMQCLLKLRRALVFLWTTSSGPKSQPWPHSPAWFLGLLCGHGPAFQSDYSMRACTYYGERLDHSYCAREFARQPVSGRKANRYRREFGCSHWSNCAFNLKSVSENEDFVFFWGIRLFGVHYHKTCTLNY